MDNILTIVLVVAAVAIIASLAYRVLKAVVGFILLVAIAAALYFLLPGVLAQFGITLPW